MPDIDFQRIELNLIPKQGDEPVVFYASQYETTRPFIADLMWGDTEFAPGDDCWAEIDIRKNDDNLVVITEDVAIDNNEVSVILPVQAVTCIGKNLGQVKIYAGDEQLIAALNFILEVQPDPLAGGVTSETAIDNLTTQIDDIISGEGYVKDTDLDVLQSDWDEADPTSPAYIKNKPSSGTQVQADWTEADTTSPAYIQNKPTLATVATTGDYDDLIDKPDLKAVATSGSYNDLTDKPTIPAAQVQSDWNQADSGAVDYIKNKPDLTLVRSALGNPCTLTTDLTDNLISVKANIAYNANGYTVGNIVRCGKNFCKPDAFSSGLPDLTVGAGIDDIIATTRYAHQSISLNQADNITISATTSDITRFDYMFVALYANGILLGHTQNSVPISNWNIDISAADTISIIIGAGDGYTVPLDITGYGNIQVELGTSSTAYEGYNGDTYTFDWSLDGTVYGGYLDVTNGTVVGTLNADGTEKVTPDVYTLTPTAIPALSGVNNLTSDLGGNLEVRYTSGDLAGQIIDICKMVIIEQGV